MEKRRIKEEERDSEKKFFIFPGKGSECASEKKSSPICCWGKKFSPSCRCVAKGAPAFFRHSSIYILSLRNMGNYESCFWSFPEGGALDFPPRLRTGGGGDSRKARRRADEDAKWDG